LEPAKLDVRSPMFEDIMTEGEGGVPDFRTYLAGEWVAGRRWVEVRSPIDLSTIARVPRLGWGDVGPALAKVYEVGRWRVRDMPGERRLEVLRRAADLMEEAAGDFINALMINAGKTRAAAEGEVRACVERLRIAAMDARKLLGDYVPGDWSSRTLESEGFVRREPYGVVLAIIPFNYPLFDTVNKFTYSVVAGNAVVVKPPSADPIPSILFARVVEAAGFPREGLAVATMPGREAGRLVSDPRVGVVSLTGSTETGVKVLRQAGVKQFIMELGGGDPAIVLDDADPEAAAEELVKGVTSYSGQRCDAIKLILAEAGIYERLKAEILRRVRGVRVGDPRRDDVDAGPLIGPEAVEEMLKAVEEAVKAGCTLLYGGRRLGPTYVEPAILEAPSKEVLKNLTLYRGEVFAPVAVMLRVKGVDEAVELANGRRYGLDAAVFGRDINKIRKLVRHLEVGAIYINESPKHGIGYYPFGGRKDSGIGREGIGYSIEYVTAYKTIVYNYRGKGVWNYYL